MLNTLYKLPLRTKYIIIWALVFFVVYCLCTILYTMFTTDGSKYATEGTLWIILLGG